jgi:hypothetical protein
MADLFAKETDNVLDVVNQDSSIADEFQGGFFDDAESNFLGIAIGKKARARKAAKRADRQAKQKYKLETERIRALQGQPKENVVSEIAGGISNIASSIFGKGGQTEAAEPVQSLLQQRQAAQQQALYEQQQAAMGQQQQGGYAAPAPAQPTKNNTVLYVIIGVAVIGAAFFLLRKK